jgi:hypothetical protein
MKKRLNVAVLVLTIAVSFAVFTKAGDPTTLHVNVPFDFYVGKDLMPAGSYVVQLDRITQASALGSRLVVRKKGSETRHVVTTVPGHLNGIQSTSRVVFRKYDDAYFLAQVNSYGTVCDLTRSRVEKEMAARSLESREQVTMQAE